MLMEQDSTAVTSIFPLIGRTKEVCEDAAMSSLHASFTTLNKQFVFFVRNCIKANPDADLSPCVEDYLKYASEILSETKQHPVTMKGPDVEAKKEKPAFFEVKPTGGGGAPTLSSLFLTTSAAPPLKESLCFSQAKTTLAPLGIQSMFGSSGGGAGSFLFSQGGALAAEIPTGPSVLASGPSLGNALTSIITPGGSTALPLSSFSFQQLGQVSSSMPLTMPVSCGGSTVLSPAERPAPFGGVGGFLSGKGSIMSESAEEGTASSALTFSMGGPVSSSMTTVPAVISKIPLPSSLFTVSPAFSTSAAPLVTPFAMAPMKSTFPIEAPAAFTFSASPNPMPFDSAVGIDTDTDGDQHSESDMAECKNHDSGPGYEADALFSVRTKLFFKLKAAFKPIGVGILNVKRLPDDDESVQLVHRIESSQSDSVLMNIHIRKGSSQIHRMGPSDLLIASPPNPFLPIFALDEQPAANMRFYLIKTRSSTDMQAIMKHLS